MATNPSLSPYSSTKSDPVDLTITDVLSALLSPLASLKLTVFLLVLAIAVVFIATLQQASVDMWAVKQMHYDNWFVTIPLQHLLIERWFPASQDVPGSIVIPSGSFIIWALIINLVAAHLLRFRIKAKGAKLGAGVVVGFIAAIVTWAMSFNTFGADGFQKGPPVNYEKMWVIMQMILLGLALACAAGTWLVGAGKRIEKSILLTFAFIAAAVLGITWYLGKDAFIGDSGMRILWQLSQATVAACVAWLACVLLFQRKAGIVLLHFGVVGLMLNEIYVTNTNVESRISFGEGETTRVAVDIRETELAILDQSDPEFDEVVTVPEAMLKSGELIEDQRLPFSIRCDSFFDNSQMKQVPPSPADPNLRGSAQGIQYSSIAPNIDGKADMATAKVELIDRQGESLGWWMVSQTIRDFVDEVSVDGKEYRIGLRFKTLYKPYQLRLKDVQAEYYTGTETPRWFSSQIELTDLASNANSDHEIWMNNPLRYNGETFYQSNYSSDRGREYSTLQVVRNRGWMIPYICCMFTVVGLAAQFGSSLLSHLKKNRNKSQQPSVAQPSVEQSSTATDELTPYSTPGSKNTTNGGTNEKPIWKSAGFLVPASVAALFAFYALSGPAKALRPLMHESGMRLDRLGEIPITHKGRIQPLDSFARNTARQFSKREFLYDKDLNKQPAIRWLADTLFRAPGHDQYRLYRIEDLEILERLGLPKEPQPGDPKAIRFRYSLDQLKKSPRKIIDALPSRETPESRWTPTQARMNGLFAKIMRNVALTALSGDQANASAAARIDIQRGKARGTLAGEVVGVKKSDWPRFVPEGNTWNTIADAENRQWLLKNAGELDAKTVSAIMGKLPDSDGSLTEYRRDEAMSIMQEIDLSKLLFTQERIDAAIESGAESRAEIAKFIMATPAGSRLRSMTFQAADQAIGEQLAEINGGDEALDPQQESLDLELAELFQEMGTAYRAGDATAFNDLTEEYLAAVRGTPELTGEVNKLHTEKIYNAAAPFYYSMVLYLIGFVVVAFGWFCSFDQKISKTVLRSAVAIIVVALILQSIGLVMRVYISGRAPITNLYSSALFVSAVFVLGMLVVEAITRMGIGSAMASIGAFGSLMWAWTMSIIDGDTFSVLVAVLDTQFWLSTHVVCITIGYSVNFMAGALGLAYIIATMLTPAINKSTRRLLANLIYGVTCFALFFSFFGTVLGGLWGDDSWGRFWGWDPKENGALMIVLWGALLLHARWGGLVKERGIAVLAVLGNIIVLWSWKGVNSMGVGLHAYAASEDNSGTWIAYVGLAHLVVAIVAMVPTRFWWSHQTQ